MLSEGRTKAQHKIMDRSFEDVANCKYLGTALTNKICMHKEIKSRLNSGKVCYHSAQSLLSSHLLPTNVKVKIHKNIILSVILYGCETWSHIIGRAETKGG
jgi:hypothetical protein